MTVAEQETSDDVLQADNIVRDDGLRIAGVLFVAVLFFLGLAAYLDWHGTGKLPWQ